MESEKILGHFGVLSTPSAGDYLSLEEALCNRLPAKLMSRFLEGSLPVEIVDILNRISVGNFSIDMFRPEFGTVGLAVTRLWDKQPDLAWIFGQFQIAAFTSAVVDCIDVKIESTWPVSVAGQVVHDDRMVVQGHNNRLQVTGKSGRLLLSLQRMESGGTPLWYTGNKAELLTAGRLSKVLKTHGAWAAEWGASNAEVRPANSCFTDQVKDAFNLLELYAPDYYLWTIALLRELVPMRRQHVDVTTSCSYLHNLGCIEICTPASVLETAEMLVHECSHQHYGLASWWTTMTRDGAPEVYSVLRSVARPLERLLVGFHAFGNVLIMYDQLRHNSAPVSKSELDERVRYVTSLVVPLNHHLEQNKDWLSKSGSSIYYPLSAKLHDLGLLKADVTPVFSSRWN